MKELAKTKPCGDCKRTLPASKFTLYRYVNKYPRKDGSVLVRKGKRLYSICRKCAVIRTTEWVAANREKYMAYQRRYHKLKKK